jgi:small subunit ribosomal protein S8
MSMADPIADMLTRIKNGLMARHNEIDLPYSKVKEAVAEVLKSEGYILGSEKIGEAYKAVLRIKLKYQGNKPVIEGMKRISKPSRRVYVGFDEIPKVLSGLGINILSTPRGIMSERLARQQRVGGEIMCSVW